MRLEIIGMNMSNVDSGELIAHSVRNYDFGIDSHRKALHNLLDAWIDTCISHNCCPDHDTFSFELRSYREHKDLELPF